jgi:hypothetical protein
LFGMGRKKEREYQEVIMNPTSRARGQARDDYVQSVIQSAMQNK